MELQPIGKLLKRKTATISIIVDEDVANFLTALRQEAFEKSQTPTKLEKNGLSRGLGVVVESLLLQVLLDNSSNDEDNPIADFISKYKTEAQRRGQRECATVMSMSRGDIRDTFKGKYPNEILGDNNMNSKMLAQRLYNSINNIKFLLILILIYFMHIKKIKNYSALLISSSSSSSLIPMGI